MPAGAAWTPRRGTPTSTATTRPAAPPTGIPVALHADAVSGRLTDLVQTVLADSGITRVNSDDPDLLVIASCGEPARTVFEQPTRLGLDHLPVVIDEDRIRIGPLVRPGLTPCVSCHDLHRADWDRAWPALVHQLGRQSVTMTPPAVDAATTHAAALEVAVEVLAHADGRRAARWGAAWSSARPRRAHELAARVPPRLHVRPASSRLTASSRLS